MDTFIRVVAVGVEVLILAGVFYCLFNGARLIIMDMGLDVKYNKMLVTVFTLIGCLLFVFLVSHLGTFYPIA